MRTPSIARSADGVWTFPVNVGRSWCSPTIARRWRDDADDAEAVASASRSRGSIAAAIAAQGSGPPWQNTWVLPLVVPTLLLRVAVMFSQNPLNPPQMPP